MLCNVHTDWCLPHTNKIKWVLWRHWSILQLHGTSKEKQVIVSLKDMPVYSEERLIETTHLTYTAQPFLSAHHPSVTAQS